MGALVPPFALGLAVCLVGWFAVAFLYRSYAFAQARRFGRRAGAPVRPLRDTRDWRLLRPLHRAPAGLEDCLASLSRAARRGGARLLLGVADPADPARKEAKRVHERFADVVASLRVGEGPRGWNPKIRNLVQLSRDAGGEVWVLSDADIRVPADYLARLAESLADPGVALATCPYRSVPGASLGSRLDALVTNTLFLPATCAAARLEGVHFALGSTVAVRREALREAGGLEALLDEPADDYALGRNVERAGHRLAWAPLLVDHVLEDGGLPLAWARHVRWSRATRSVRPRGYAGLVAMNHGWVAGIAAGAAAAALGASALWSLALPALWWGAAALQVAASRSVLRVAPRDLALLPLAEVFALAAQLAGLSGRATPPR